MKHEKLQETRESPFISVDRRQTSDLSESWRHSRREGLDSAAFLSIRPFQANNLTPIVDSNRSSGKPAPVHICGPKKSSRASWSRPAYCDLRATRVSDSGGARRVQSMVGGSWRARRRKAGRRWHRDGCATRVARVHVSLTQFVAALSRGRTRYSLSLRSREGFGDVSGSISANT